MKKLKLENLKVKTLTKEEQKTVKGGQEQEFLSIGVTCSLRNSCERVCGPVIA